MDDRTKRVKKAFDEFSKEYDKFMVDTGHSQARDEIIRLIFPEIVGKVLDIATGTGAIAEKVRSMGFDVVGVDQSKEMIKLARTKNPNIKFLISPVERLPFENNSFDTVICCLGLEWVSDKIQALKEMDRVSKGRVILMEEEGVIKSVQKESGEDVNTLFKEFNRLEDLAEPEFFKRNMFELGYQLKKEVKTDIDGKHSLIGMVFIKIG